MFNTGWLDKSSQQDTEGLPKGAPSLLQESSLGTITLKQLEQALGVGLRVFLHSGVEVIRNPIELPARTPNG